MERFDLGSGEAGQRLYVYDVKNVKAADLAQTLGDVFGGSSGSPAARSTGVAPGLEPVRVSTMTSSRDRGGKSATPGSDGGPANPESGGGNLSISGDGDVRFSSVEESNSLIVRATSAQWESIRRVIERLDVVPLQVAIEAQIISVTLNDALNYGVQYYFENAVAGSLGDAAGELAGTRRSWTDTSGFVASADASGPSAIGWTFVGPNAGAVLSLLDTVSDVRVLSAPTLVVLNNKSASINSGRSIPINSTSIDLGNGNNNTVTNTQYLQTGITLTVTPRVNPGGLVFLEIEQEDSNAGASAGGNPPIDQNTISTEVAIQSGQTVLLGGLIKQTDNNGSSGVPGLHKLPLIGGLFGKKNTSSNRQELLVLITPKVINNGDQARQITEQYKSQFRALQPLRAAPASQ